LAYLAREGLITEIITTNWDCGIEHAFGRSFGWNRESAAGEALAVIRNLYQYRTGGGRRYTRDAHYRPILHLYKINGCAQEYGNYLQAIGTIHQTDPSFEPGVAQRLVLTERQLQTFRSEYWARDLFQDRRRTHALLLCGFGSEEPQVRHTALQRSAATPAVARHYGATNCRL
jgi:SIR2-like domain